VPKTYNQRQLDQMRLEAAHKPPVPEAPDVARFIRYFHPDDVRQLADRMEKRVAAGKVTQTLLRTSYSDTARPPLRAVVSTTRRWGRAERA
jgi:hypothetical protein